MVRGTTGREVSAELGSQAIVVYEEERMKGAWVTVRKAIALIYEDLGGGGMTRKKSCRRSWNLTMWGSSG